MSTFVPGTRPRNDGSSDTISLLPIDGTTCAAVTVGPSRRAVQPTSASRSAGCRSVSG
jgi:hypothetical protein